MNKEPIAGAIPFPDEIAHLETINRALTHALQDAEANVERLDNDYMDMKRYMVERRGELDPHELFQNELGLRQIDHTGAFAVKVRDKLAKLQDSPYFARIDFRSHANKEADAFYIEFTDRAHSRQCLTPETEGGNGIDIFHAFHLAGGKTFHGKGQICIMNTGTVVGDTDQIFPATVHLRDYTGGARVKRVLHQFFHNVDGALHHFPRSNAGSGDTVQAFYFRHINYFLKRYP